MLCIGNYNLIRGAEAARPYHELFATIFVVFTAGMSTLFTSPGRTLFTSPGRKPRDPGRKLDAERGLSVDGGSGSGGFHFLPGSLE